MPYISKDRRSVLDFSVLKIADGCRDWGEVNYVITTIVTKLVLRFGLSYPTINAALGCFTAAREEFYGRVVGPYEERKIHKNGDVRVYEEIDEIMRKEWDLDRPCQDH